MAFSSGWLRCAAVVAGTSLVLIAAGGTAFAGPTPPNGPPPTVATDCFGNQVDVWTVLVVPAGGAPFFGTAGNDVIVGTDGYDRIYGLAGDDTICGSDGGDLIYGDGGNDDIDGEGGTDTLFGGVGDDYILGGTNTASFPYHEALYGDDGVDYLRGQSGTDTLLCGGISASWDPGDIADGGTGMPGNLPEDDIVASGDCPSIGVYNVP